MVRWLDDKSYEVGNDPATPVGGCSTETWARTGYAAWNSFHRDKPAKLHLVTPSRAREGAWVTACGMLYVEKKVADGQPDDTRCGHCERKR